MMFTRPCIRQGFKRNACGTPGMALTFDPCQSWTQGEAVPRTPMRIAAATAALAVSLAAAGCNTVGGYKSASNVRMADSSYKAGQELPPDIKQILMAGGLNADNPSAPSRPPVALAAAVIDTMPAEEVVHVMTKPPSGQVLMAARGLGPSPTFPSTSSTPSAVAPRLPGILLAASKTGGPSKSIAVASGASAKSKVPVRVASAARVPVPPASPVPRHQEQAKAQGSLIRFASVGGAPSEDAKGVRADRADGEPMKKIVRRF